MGRMRIKKKDEVIPFRETLAYRLLLSTLAVFLFMGTIYFLIHYASTGNQTGMLISVIAAVMAGTAVFYNLGQVRNARVPLSSLKRARRR